MSLVWRRLKRSHQEAYKYKFTVSIQQLLIQCTAKWHPDTVVIAWIRKRSGRSKRRTDTQPKQWEPSLTNPLKGLLNWPKTNPELLEIETTLYKDKRTQAFDDKEWTFIIEEVDEGRRKPIASVPLNLRLFIDDPPGTQTEVKLKLKSHHKHLTNCVLEVILTCQLVKAGSAFDEDMESISSMMSMPGRRLDPDQCSIPEDDSFDNLQTGSDFQSGSEDFQRKIKEMVKEISDDSMPDECQRSDDTVKLEPDTTVITEAIVNVSETVEASEHTVETSVRWRATQDVVVTAAKMEYDHVEADIKHHAKVNGDVDVGSLDNNNLSTETRASQLTSGDLLQWCQEVTKDHAYIKQIDNFGKCWRNGLAFCAIIHHFRPDLINYSQLMPDNIKHNNETAFSTAADLGVARLIDPNEMVISNIPDKIAVMTYVYQLRAFFTGGKLQDNNSSVEQPRLSRFNLADHLDSQVADEFERLLIQRERESIICLNDVTSHDVTPKDVISNGINETSSPKRTATIFNHAQTPSRSTSKGRLSRKSSARSSRGSSPVFRRYPENVDTLPNIITVTDSITEAVNRLPRPNSIGKRLQRNSSTASNKSLERRDSETQLMTRHQLMNPFDSDEDDNVTRLTLTDQVTVNNVSTTETSTSLNVSSGEIDSRDVTPIVIAESHQISLTPLSPLERDPGSPNGTNDEDSTDLKKRALKVLEEFRQEDQTKKKQLIESPVTPDAPKEEEDDRKKQLRIRARQLIAEATEQTLGPHGQAIPISRTVPQLSENDNRSSQFGRRNLFSAPATRLQSPVVDSSVVINGFGSVSTTTTSTNDLVDVNYFPLTRKPSLKSLSVVRPQISIYQFKPTVLQHRSLFDSQQSKDFVDADDLDNSTNSFDRFKRFGSMKAEELSTITSRLANSLRNNMVVPPKEVIVSKPQTVPETIKEQSPRLSNFSDSSPQQESPVNVEIPDAELNSIEAINAELEHISRQHEQVDKKATLAEKKFRLHMENDSTTNAAEDEKLMTEFLQYVNQRNILTRREHHLHLKLKIKDHEARFREVQDELAILYNIDDRDKTEQVKQKIDSRMNELIALVNTRDELAQELISNEEGEEFDEKLGANAITRVMNEYTAQNSDDKNCALM